MRATQWARAASASESAGKLHWFMSDAAGTDLWSKVNLELVEVASGDAEEKTSNAEDWKAYWRFRRPFLDLCGAVLWVYWILKVAVADVDRWVFGDIADYRFFAYLIGTVVIVIWFRRTGRIVAGLAYIIGYPVVVMCWKVPKWFMHSRSFVTFFAALNAVTSVIGNLRYSIITFALAAFAALAVAVSGSDVALAAAGTVTLGLVALALHRTLRYSVTPSAFLRMQQQAIRKWVNSKPIQSLIEPDDTLRRPEIEKFNSYQQQQFVQSLAQGVMIHRALGYWAYQLERYRRSPASLFLNALGYIWLTLKVIAGIAVINYALYQADPTAFKDIDSPGFLVFVRYSIAGLYGSEIAAVTPSSDLANALSITNFLLGLILLGGLVASSLLSFRASRNESDIRDTVAEIRREGHMLDRQIRENYDVTIPEAIARLRTLQSGAADLLLRLIPQFPDPVEEDSAPE